MTVNEAVGLVLQSATLGEGGEIFVLDMGQPMKISDLARQLIELSGLEPDTDIEIKYTGLRRTKRGQAADIDIDRCGSRPKLPAWLANSDSNSPGPATT